MKKYMEQLKKGWHEDMKILGDQISEELQTSIKDDYEEYGEIRYEGVYLAQVTHGKYDKTFDIRLAQLSKIIDKVEEIKSLSSEIDKELETAKYITILAYLRYTASTIKETDKVSAQA
ncbi:MAG TPA: hypothetical protein GXZ90_09125 [Clostridiales bacterium]|nr:hypothetical protein [Clostridiales bacterium]